MLFESPVIRNIGYDVSKKGDVFYVAGYEASETSPIVFVTDTTSELPLSTNAR